MMPRSGKLAVFDCDGTLVDSQAGICAAMDAAFAAASLAPPDRHAVRRTVGLSLEHAIAGLLPHRPETLHAEVSAHFREAFKLSRETGALTEPLYDGIPELLDALRARGWALGVATGKSDRGLIHCLSVHGLSDRFVTLQTADRHPSKPHPAMLEAALAEAGVGAADAVMIGDTSYDMAMARAAGVRAIGVDWGYHDPAELRASGAQAVALTPRELDALL